MTLIAHSKLPTFERLREEGIEVLSPDRAMHQDIRELHITGHTAIRGGSGISEDVLLCLHGIDRKIKDKNPVITISLSGGVDSMVLTFIIGLIQKKNICTPFTIQIIHFNYMNREESKKESDLGKNL